MKTWNFNGHEYTMEKTGYGQYTLNGLHCTDSSIWDWCDDDSDEDKHLEALQAAETYVMASEEDDYSNVKDLSEDEYKACVIALAEVLRGGGTSYVSMSDVDRYLGSEMLRITEGEDGRTYAHFIATVGEAAVDVSSKEILTAEEIKEILC